MNYIGLEERLEELGVVRAGEQPTTQQITKQLRYITQLDEQLVPERRRLKHKLASSHKSAEEFYLPPSTLYNAPSAH